MQTAVGYVEEEPTDAVHLVEAEERLVYADHKELALYADTEAAVGRIEVVGKPEERSWGGNSARTREQHGEADASAEEHAEVLAEEVFAAGAVDAAAIVVVERLDARADQRVGLAVEDLYMGRDCEGHRVH